MDFNSVTMNREMQVGSQIQVLSEWTMLEREPSQETSLVCSQSARIICCYKLSDQLIENEPSIVQPVYSISAILLDRDMVEELCPSPGVLAVDLGHDYCSRFRRGL